jgi:hypothetical protein
MHSIQTNNSDQLLRVNGTFANFTNLLFTSDSASSVSMMSESTAHHYKFPIHPSDIQTKPANNAATSVVGVTDSLLIDIQGHICKVPFIVHHHDDHEILLGLDWFTLTGACLHPRELLLKFHGTSVPIFHNPSALDDEFDDSEAPMLSSIVVDEDYIDFDIDWFIDNNISMEPVEKLTPSQLVEFEALKLSSEQSFATAYDSLGCCTLSKHEIILDSRTPIYSHPYRKSIKERSMNFENC